MKIFKYLLVMLMLSGISAKAFEEKIKDTTKVGPTVPRDPKKYFLQIKSVVYDSKGPDKIDKNKTVKGAIIKIMNKDNRLIASYFTDKKGKSDFPLALDNKYTVIILKKGYTSKIIEIDSRIPGNINNAYIFPVDIAIFEEIKDLNTEVLNKPVARVEFMTSKMEFDYDQVYTHKVNADLNKMYKEYYEAQKATLKKKK